MFPYLLFSLERETHCRRSFLQQCLGCVIGLLGSEAAHACWGRSRRRVDSWGDYAGQARLRNVAAEDIRSGQVEHSFRMVVNGGYLDVELPGVSSDNAQLISGIVGAQYDVEAIRYSLCTRSERRFWQPYLNDVERLVSEELACPYDPIAASSEITEPRERIAQEIIRQALNAYARRLGLKVGQLHETKPHRVYAVVVVTTSGSGVISIIPSTDYRICAAIGRKPEFKTYTSGQTAQLGGRYYYVVEGNGKATAMRTVVIDSEGTWTFMSP